MEDKYTGCNIVESVVTETQKPQQSVNDKKPRRGTSLLLRLFIAAAIVGGILVLHYCQSITVIGNIASVARQVFCYDIFGRTEFGVTAVFG